MSFKTPKEITETGIQTGMTKAKLSWDKALVASFLAAPTGTCTRGPRNEQPAGPGGPWARRSANGDRDGDRMGSAPEPAGSRAQQTG